MNVIGIASIGKLWARFYQEGMGEQIPGRIDPSTTLGVYTNYEDDHTGAYTLLIGVEVERLDEVPDGMKGIAIPAADYLVFPAHGPLPDAITETWSQIWNWFSDDKWLRRSYISDIEIYRFNPQLGQQEPDIAIAIK